METVENEIIRETFFYAATPPINEVRRFVAKVHEVYIEVRRESTTIDQQIADFHFGRRMRFVEIASELGMTENSVRRRWYRLLQKVADLLQERVTSDEGLVSLSSLMIKDPDALHFVVPTLLSLQNTGASTKITEATMLRRAVRTFGNHADAVHWLLDDCPALGGRPVDLLIDPAGVRDVENVLGCIDHGLIF